MFQFILGVISGIYLAQEYPKDIPRVSTKIKNIIDKLKEDEK